MYLDEFINETIEKMARHVTVKTEQQVKDEFLLKTSLDPNAFDINNVAKYLGYELKGKFYERRVSTEV